MPISKNQTAILDACALEANRILFEKIGRYAQSVGANYLRSGDVQRALSTLGRTLISRARAQCGSEHNARNGASITVLLIQSFRDWILKRWRQLTFWRSTSISLSAAAGSLQRIPLFHYRAGESISSMVNA